MWVLVNWVLKSALHFNFIVSMVDEIRARNFTRGAVSARPIRGEKKRGEGVRGSELSSATTFFGNRDAKPRYL